MLAACIRTPHLSPGLRAWATIRARTISTATGIPRVHILGLGSVGTLAAHCLAEIPQRPHITLLAHRASLLEDYVNNGSKMQLETKEGQVIPSTGYDFEVQRGGEWYTATIDGTRASLGPPIRSPIKNLILCTKTYQTVPALLPLKHRLTRDSTILFLQNGAGMMEEATSHVFTNPSTRPNYMTGVIAHGVNMTSPFHVQHTGPAWTALGLVPRDDGTVPSPSSYDLPHLLPQSPRLNATVHPFTDALQYQLEKVSVNSLSNAVGALANASCTYVLHHPPAHTLRHALLAEISTVILRLPELSHLLRSRLLARFSPEALDSTVMSVIEQNEMTTCSMVWDLRKGKKSEAEFINGYWVRRGKEVGVRTPVNEELVERVEEREGGGGKYTKGEVEWGVAERLLEGIERKRRA